MTTYYVEGLQCSHCSERFAYVGTASHNTFGATYYTDGYVSGPTYDEGSALVVCPHCSRVAWLDSHKSLFVERDYIWFSRPENNSVPFGLSVEARHYADALAASLWRTPDEEAYLRTRVWWYGNDRRRSNDRASIPLLREEEENLRRLLVLLDGNTSIAIVRRAEIFRELGAFKECLAELRSVTDAELSQTVAVIERLANRTDRRVAVLAPPPKAV